MRENTVNWKKETKLKEKRFLFRSELWEEKRRFWNFNWFVRCETDLFVNMMSLAPKVHLVVSSLAVTCQGRQPQTVGSSKLRNRKIPVERRMTKEGISLGFMKSKKV